MTDMVISKLNESFLKIECDTDLAYELSEAFTFQVEGYKFTPAYKRGVWDGKIRLLNLGKRTFPVGLFEKLIEFCEQRNYTYSTSARNGYSAPGSDNGITYELVEEYIASLNLHGGGKPVQVRDYQIEGVHVSLNKQRGILLSATGSGKSLMLYATCRYITEVLNQRVLIIVPTISLTSQMKSDFADYSSHNGWNADENVHLITAGVSKEIDKPIVISTFQSIYKMPAEWFNGNGQVGMLGYGAIICDEGHKIQSATIAGIYEKATEVKIKLACTGTVQDMKCHVLAMQGLTGPVYDIASTKRLIQNKQLVPLEIKALVLDYKDEVGKTITKAEYDDEIKFIASNTKRNNFITNLALSCKGTTLVLYRFVDIQGKLLYNNISTKTTDRPVHFINGDVKGDDREEVRMSANETDSIIVASYQTFAAGINLPAIENIIFAHPFKSKITGLQSIGRGLRLKEGKTKCVLFDIADNISYKNKINNTYRHFGERLKMYIVAGFTFDITHLKFNHE